VATTLILLVIVTLIVIPAVVLLGIGRTDKDAKGREQVEPTGTDGELPELLRRPLRAGPR
jgi:hypothetical protein